MNRLIIIGNGFDLAHGLPTSYRDFIDDYYINAANVFFEKGQYNDELLSIEYKSNTIFTIKPNLKNIDEIFKFFTEKSIYVKLVYHNALFENLIEFINWVDIANEYYKKLKKIIKKK